MTAASPTAQRDSAAERAAVRDLAAVRPPSWAAALNLLLGAVFLASLPLGFFAVDAHPRWALLITPWLVCCFTGLFILAHEAIHQTLVPGSPRLGHALGWLFAFAFVFMDYGTLRARHCEHRRDSTR